MSQMLQWIQSLSATKATLEQQEDRLKNVGHGDAEVHEKDHGDPSDRILERHGTVDVDSGGALPRHDHVHDGNVVRGVLEGGLGEVLGRRHVRILVGAA